MDLSSIALLVRNNPLLTLGAGAGAFASLKSVPGTLLSLGKRQIMTSVNITSSDSSYVYLQEWLHAAEGLNPRDLQVVTLYRSGGSSSQPKALSSSGDENDTYLATIPAPGTHTFKYKGRRIWMTLNREKPDNYGRRVEDMTLTTIGRDSKPLLSFLSEIESLLGERDDGKLRVFIQSYGDWKEFSRKKPRALDSVVLADRVKEDLLSDLRHFIQGEEKYLRLGIPYRRGYLLYGPPGNGKSSVVECLAGELRYDLYVLSLGAKSLDDGKLMELLARVPPKGIVLIEDVDSAFVDREKAGKESSSVTFSGLLNALDGVASKPGQIVMMSTNHIEKLDHALLRRGRSDVKAHIDNATENQAARLFQRFFPEASDEFAQAFGLKGVCCSMARLQDHLGICESAEQALATPIQE